MLAHSPLARSLFAHLCLHSGWCALAVIAISHHIYQYHILYAMVLGSKFPFALRTHSTLFWFSHFSIAQKIKLESSRFPPRPPPPLEFSSDNNENQ